MLKSSMMRAAGVALAVASVLFLRGYEAVAQTTPPAATPAPAPPQTAPATPPAAATPAAAQPVSDTTAFYVNIVDLEISPSLISRFMADLSDDVKGTLS
jgi:hypothetical protein